MKKWRKNSKLLVLIFLEVSLFLIFLAFIINQGVIAGFGTGNVTVRTNLTIGNVYPEILNVTINNGNNIILTPNSTSKVYCFAHIVDYNGDDDISVVRAEFFDNVTSSYGDGDDNNTHYTNNSCDIDTSYGDAYTAGVNCTFDVWYYANAQYWNCTIRSNDSYNWENINSSLTTVNELLALGLPDWIDYGTVNATAVSNENVTNVTNYGNVALNLSLNGYGHTPGDGNSFNCTLGAVKNISIEFEKYNLTSSTPGDLSHAHAIGNYTNLTTDPVVREFDLEYRRNENINEAWNQTYWRVYVPLGVAGSCQGNIIFAATTANGI